MDKKQSNHEILKDIDSLLKTMILDIDVVKDDVHYIKEKINEKQLTEQPMPFKSEPEPEPQPEIKGWFFSS